MAIPNNLKQYNMNRPLFFTFALALMLSGTTFAQHRAVRTTTDPNTGMRLEYGISNMENDRATMDEPEILWQKYESGATPDDVYFIDATGDFLVYYGLNEMRLNVSDLQSGVYFIRVSNETTNAVGKFVVE